MQSLNPEKDFVSLIKRMMNGNFNLDELLKEQITNSKFHISKNISKKSCNQVKGTSLTNTRRLGYNQVSKPRVRHSDDVGVKFLTLKRMFKPF